MLKHICIFSLVLAVFFSPSTAQCLNSFESPPYEGGYDLQDIWGFGPDDVYAVGRYGVVIHFDGVGWETIRNDDTSMYCIWGTSPTNIYTSDSESIYHYDGENWGIVFDTGLWDNISDIWGSGPEDIYAVGRKVWHFDGSQWEAVYHEGPVQSEVFKAIWGSGPSDVFVLGNSIHHYDGSLWSEMADIATGPLGGIWGTAWNDVYVVGGGDDTIVHYDGVEWSVIYSEEGGGGFCEIWGSGPDDIYVYGGWILHFDGFQWSSVEYESLAYPQAIWGSGPEDVFLVGDQGTIVHLGSSEVCVDNDGDGFGNPPSSLCQYPSTLDCDDNDPHISPAGQEEPFNDVDEDCNGHLALNEGICFISIVR